MASLLLAIYGSDRNTAMFISAGDEKDLIRI